MITGIQPAPTGLRPPAPTVAAANAAANRPSAEDIHALAGQLRQVPLPGGYASAPASLPGLGGHLDLYDTAGDTVGKQAAGLHGGGGSAETPFKTPGEDFDQGLATFEPLQAPHDFPYLKPLPSPSVGNLLNTLV